MKGVGSAFTRSPKTTHRTSAGTYPKTGPKKQGEDPPYDHYDSGTTVRHIKSRKKKKKEKRR